MKTLLKLWTCCDGLIADLVTIAGVAVAGIGCTGLIGYVLENRGAYTWFPSGAPMAFPTCVAFTITGVSVLMLAYRVTRLEKLFHKNHPNS